MAFAETANLAVKLTLGGNFTSQMSKANAQLNKLSANSGRAYKAGAQIGTGIRNATFIAVAALGTLAGALAVAVKDGQDAANVQKIYAQAIANSGKVTADQVTALNAQQKALEDLAGVDDELIKSEQTRLIQMGLSGKATEKLTPLILDAAKATGKDLLTVTIAAGKAANGNATALQRLGIMVDKTRFKVDPLAETIRVLNERFGGTTQALSGSFNTRLDALRQHLKDIGENVGITLLPALTRIVGVVGSKLVPALGKFVDRILPDINSGLNDFADALSNGGAEEAIKGITGALGPMIDLIKIAAAPVKAIVSAFLSLPSQVQTVLIAGFAVNKLTGGLVTNVAGGIIESIGKGLIGGIKAPLVNVSGGVVNVNGGVGGGGGGLPNVIGSGSGLLGAVGGVVGIATIASVVIPLALLAVYAGSQPNPHPGVDKPGLYTGKTDYRGAAYGAAAAAARLAAARDMGTGSQGSMEANRGAIGDALGTAELVKHLPMHITHLEHQLVGATGRNAAAIKAEISKEKTELKAAIYAQGASARVASNSLTGGIERLANSPTPVKITGKTTVTIHFSATDVGKTTTVASRYGVGGGSRNTGVGGSVPGGL